MEKRFKIISFAYLLFLMALKFAVYLFPEFRAWGINHFLFLPDSQIYLFAGISVLFLAVGFSRKMTEIVDSLLRNISNLIFESQYRVPVKILIAAVFGALFAIFSGTTHFLGDGYGYLNIFGKEGSIVFRGNEYGAALLAGTVSHFLSGFSHEPSLLAFRIFSIASGIISVWFIFNISKLISSEPLNRILLFLSLLFSGQLLMFFGYVEFYPLLWMLMLIYFYFSIKSGMSDKLPLWPLALFLIGTAYHVLFVIFVPGLIYLLLASGSGKKLYHRLKKPFWVTCIIILIVAIILFFNKYTESVSFRNQFLPLFHGKPIDLNYFVFSYKHLLDMVNELLLIAPLVPLLLILLVSRRYLPVKSVVVRFFALTAIGGVLFFLFVDPQLGMARDWDLFACCLLPLALTGYVAFYGKNDNPIKAPAPALILILLLTSLPYVMVNVNYQPSIEYTEYLIGLDTRKTYGAYSVIMNQYYNSDNWQRASQLYEKYGDLYLGEKYGLILKTIEKGQLRQAMRLIRQIRPDEYNADYQYMLAEYHYVAEEYDSSLFYIDKVIDLRPYQDGDYYSLRGAIYLGQGKYRKSLDDVRMALRIDSKSLKVLSVAMQINSAVAELDSLEYYARKALTVDSTFALSYYYLSLTILKKGQGELAKKTARLFLRYSENDDSYATRRKEIEDIFGL